jgi:hypothetical protein
MQSTIDTTNGPVLAGHCHTHAVCWKSILAGAATAAVVSLILLSLGSGIGLATMSPYSGDESSIAGFTVKMAVWMICMQWASAALGGYVTGRLGKNAVGVHKDEVFFRDTAHGFLTWAVATLFTAAFLAAAVTTAATGAAKAATVVAASAAAGAGKEAADQSGGFNGVDYYTDSLFRGAVSDANGAETRKEVTRIFVNGFKGEAFPAADRDYLAQVVATRTGLSPAEAGARVDQTIAQMNEVKAEAKETADKARKASSAFSIFTALSMLIGAFIAAVAAAIGGGHRACYPNC